MIANSGSNEIGTLYGGEPGDQTGAEWRVRPWYSCPWWVVLRHPDQALALEAATLARHAAANDCIGYNQINRMSLWRALEATGTYDPADITDSCDGDCSAGVTAVWKAAGIRLGDERLATLDPGTYTGNLRSRFMAAGFQALSSAEYLDSDELLMPGDVLLRDGYHTAINLDVGGGVTDWNPENKEDKLNDEQNAALMQLLRTDDPSGRGCTGSNIVDRVAWLGKKTDDILENQKTLGTKLDAIVKKLDACLTKE